MEGVSVEAVIDRRLRDTYTKVGISSLRCARYALTRLSDFGASLGLAGPTFMEFGRVLFERGALLNESYITERLSMIVFKTI